LLGSGFTLSRFLGRLGGLLDDARRLNLYVAWIEAEPTAMTAIGMTANPAKNALLDSGSMGAVRFVATAFWANQIPGYSISGSFSSTA
jgi:hypothetical protein